MDSVDLYQALLTRYGMTTNALARRLVESGLAKTNLQSHLFRWEQREAKNPSTETLGPVARYFKVDMRAFYDPVVARSEAFRLGFETGADAQPPRPPARERATDALSCLRELAQALSESDRLSVAELVRAYLSDAEASERKARAICDLLEDDGPTSAEPRKRRAA